MTEIVNRFKEIEIDTNNLISWEGQTTNDPQKSKGNRRPPQKNLADSSRISTTSNDSDNVEPLPIYSERDLQQDITKINEDLFNMDPEDWKKRLTALKRIQGLVLGGALEYDIFTQALFSMKDAFAKQVSCFVRFRISTLYERLTTSMLSRLSI